jgi:hypothetical protein
LRFWHRTVFEGRTLFSHKNLCTNPIRTQILVDESEFKCSNERFQVSFS